MGDRGGRKDKQKGQKQHATKQQQKATVKAGKKPVSRVKATTAPKKKP